MLQNINSYGLSHLCAFSIFEPAEEAIADLSFNYSFLDIHFKYAQTKHEVKFYSSGFKYDKTSVKNIFEYLILTEQSGSED